MAKKKRKQIRAARLRLRKALNKQANTEKKQENDRNALFSLQKGGAPATPIVVTTAAVIELRAGKVPCPQCAGLLSVDEHEVEGHLRRIQCHCQQCHSKRALWFQIRPEQLN